MPYAGFSDADLAAYFGVSPQQGAVIGRLASGQIQPNDMSQIMAWQNQDIGGSGPSGAATKFGDIEWGLTNLGAHPFGSQHHGGLGGALGGTLANFATGGLYGAGKAASDVASGDLSGFQGTRAGLNQLGPFGSSTYNASPQLAEKGNLSGLLAGGGAMLFGGGAAATPTGPEGIPYLTDPSGFAGQSVGIDPLTGGAIPGAGLTPDQLTGLAGGAGAFGGGNAGAGVGALAGQQLAGLLNPQQKQGFGVPGMPMQGGMQGGIPQQPAFQGGGASERHRGLAYPFEQRQRGRQEDPGIAALYNIGGR